MVQGFTIRLVRPAQGQSTKGFMRVVCALGMCTTVTIFVNALVLRLCFVVPCHPIGCVGGNITKSWRVFNFQRCGTILQRMFVKLRSFIGLIMVLGCNVATGASGGHLTLQNCVISVDGMMLIGKLGIYTIGRCNCCRHRQRRHRGVFFRL